MSEYIKGMDQLVSKLATLKKTTAKSAIRKGTRQGAKQLQTVAKRLAPHRTGALERGIKVRAITRSRKYVGTKVTLTLPYGSYTELGTHKEAAQHFLQRSAKQAGKDALETTLETIQTEIGNL